MKKSAEGADNPLSRHPHTLNRIGVMVVMLGEGGVTVERMDMMAEGGRDDKWRVMSDNCNKSPGLPGVVVKSGGYMHIWL